MKVSQGDYIKMYGFAVHRGEIIECTTHLLGHIPGFVTEELKNGYLQVRTIDGRDFRIHRRACCKMGVRRVNNIRKEQDEQHNKDTRNNQPGNIPSEAIY